MGDLITSYFILYLLTYFLPTIIALILGCDRTGSVLVMNLFLGWTFIGWVWAFVWAVSPNRQQQNIVINNHVSADRTINPIITQPIQERFESYGNTHSLPKPPPQLENVNIKSHQDKIGQLQQMKQLLDTGILTQEEFDEQKSKILAS